MAEDKDGRQPDGKDQPAGARQDQPAGARQDQPAGARQNQSAGARQPTAKSGSPSAAARPPSTGGARKPPTTIDLKATEDASASRTSEADAKPDAAILGTGVDEPDHRTSAAQARPDPKRPEPERPDPSPASPQGSRPPGMSAPDRAAESSRPPARAGLGMATAVALAALIGAAVALAASYAFRPDTGVATAELQQLRDQIAALRTAPRQTADTGALNERLGRLEATTRELASAGDAAPDDPRIEQLAAAVEQLRESAAAGGSADDAALQPLTQRLDAIDARLNELAGRVDRFEADPPVDADARRAALGMAIGAVRLAARSGEPFTAELETLRAVGGDPAAIEALAGPAAAGVPSAASLADAFGPVADAIIAAAETVPEDAGVVDRLVSHAASLVTVRPAGPIGGDGATAIVSRMEAAVEDGDLATALREREALPEPGKAASADWAEDAAARVALDERLAALATPAQPAAPAASGG